MKKRQVLFQVCVFLTGFICLFCVATKICIPKYLYDSKYWAPETEIWEEFYSLEEDSLDFLYVGSSHVYNGVNAVQIYEQTGYTGFDLCSSGQDIMTAYFYLKEALRFQHPQYVFMDVYGMSYDSMEREICYKRSLDWMKWSDVKMEAVQTWLRVLPQESLLPRVFTLLDFHSRWDSLSEDDFNYKEKMSHWGGYIPTVKCQTVLRNKYHTNENIIVTGQNISYFERIISLCEENDIKLVLFCAPFCEWTQEKNTTVKNLAAQYGLTYWDFNTDAVYPGIGLSVLTDYRDTHHLNVRGSEKFTDTFIKYLKVLDASPREHSDSVTAAWQEKVTEWQQTKERLIVQCGK